MLTMTTYSATLSDLLSFTVLLLRHSFYIKDLLFFRTCIVILPCLLLVFGNSLKHICTKTEDKIHSWKYIAIYIYSSFFEQEEFDMLLCVIPSNNLYLKQL